MKNLPEFFYNIEIMMLLLIQDYQLIKSLYQFFVAVDGGSNTSIDPILMAYVVRR